MNEEEIDLGSVNFLVWFLLVKKGKIVLMYFIGKVELRWNVSGKREFDDSRVNFKVRWGEL